MSANYEFNDLNVCPPNRTSEGITWSLLQGVHSLAWQLLFSMPHFLRLPLGAVKQGRLT